MKLELKSRTTNRNKIYALLIEARDAIFLSSQYASSLEEALAMAKKEYSRMNHIEDTVDLLKGAKIGLFSIKTLGELVEENKAFKKKKIPQENVLKATEEEKEIIATIPELKDLLPKKEEPLDKNKLMVKIINAKDKQMFEENKKVFSKNEQKYIQERLD